MTTTLTKLLTAEKAATPGPWRAVDATESTGGRTLSDDPDEIWTVSTDPTEDGFNTDSGCYGYGISKANAEFIALARNHVVGLAECARVLLELEWSFETDTEQSACPCRYSREVYDQFDHIDPGHEPNCQLDAALRLAGLR